MLDVLLGAKPSSDVLAAFFAFYRQNMPSDLPALRKAARAVAQLARAEPESKGASFRFYLEAISRMVANHIDHHAISEAESQQIKTLVCDLQEWGFAQHAELIERSMALAMSA